MIRWIIRIGLLMPALATAGTVTPYDPSWGSIGVFSPASLCDACHPASPLGDSPAIMRAPLAMDPTTPDPTGADISPGAGERTSIMGQALHDPYFRAVVEDEVDTFPSLAGPIEDTCLRCHAPMGHSYAHSEGTGAFLDGDGFYRMTQADTDMHARAGISCTLCHQVQFDQPIGELANGAYQVRTDFVIIGPYLDPATGGMAQYGVEGDLAIRDSELCGSCHNLYTDVVDADTGLLTGLRFLEQGTWFEWRNSAFGGPMGDGSRTNCHVCHMPQPGAGYQTRVAVTGIPTIRDTFGTHDIPGGNTHTLAMLSDYRTELGLDPSLTAAEFDRAIEGTRAFLETAADLSLTSSSPPGALTLQVTIDNLTGHKLPSGFPSRRMWLHLEVRDRFGALFESGRDDAQGRLDLDAAFTQSDCVAVDKPPGFDSTPCFEPHRDQITDPAQVALYESVMADSNGDITHVLLHAGSYLKDNRIPPAGFVEMGPDFVADTASVGVTGDLDFNAAGSGSDTVTYVIDTLGGAGPYQVTARLLYQSIRPSFVDGMQTSGTRVTDFKGYYSDLPPPVEILTQVSETILGEDVVFFGGFED